MRRLTALVALALLAGCATVDAPGTGSLGAGPQDTSRTLRIMGSGFPYTDATVAEFSRRHPDINVQYTKGTVSFEEGSAQTLLRSGRGPDVLLVNSGPGRVGMLADAGLIMQLDDTIDRQGLAERYTPEVLRQTRSAKDGHVYEIVEGLDVFQVRYNTAIFERHGLAVPRDWQSFLQTCTTLKQRGVQPISAGIRDNFAGGWLLGSLVQAAAGRDVVREVLAGTRPFDDPAVVAGGRMLAELLERGCIDRGQAAALDGGQMQAAFWRGAAAMTVVPQGSAIDARLDGNDTSHFGSFPMPSANGEQAIPTAGLAVSWVVNDSTRSLSAVQAWVRWLASEDYLALTAKHGRTLVPAQQVPAGVQLDPGIRDSLEKVAKGTGFNPSVYLQEGAKQAWYDAVQGLVTGRMTPEQAMAGVREAIEEAR